MDRLAHHAQYQETLGRSRQDCRGFVGRLSPRASAPSAIDTPVLTAWHGDAALALDHPFEARSLRVTGGARHGRANALARDVLTGRRSVDTLTHIAGGEGCAFALHDAKTGHTVLGRDRHGIMPLYFARNGQDIVFATELAALNAAMGSPAGLNPDALAMYLDHGFIGGDLSPLANVRRIKPGEIVHIDARGEMTRHRSSDVQPPEHFRGSLTEAMDAFDGMFDRAVNDSLDSTREAALLLSGGLDSALICASVGRRQERLRTFSVGYDFTDKRDELSAARQIAERCDTRHTDVRLSASMLWSHIPFMVWQTDELMDDSATLSTSLLANLLPRDLSILTGEGADDVFAGDGQYRLRRPQRWWLDLATPGSGGWRTEGHIGTLRRAGLFNHDLRRAADAHRDDMIDAWLSAPRDATWIQRAQWSELEAIFPNTLALKVGRSFQGSTRNVHMPFVDPDVVAFGLSLKDSLKKRGDTGKWFLRHWACRRLPREHVFRPKRGFYMPTSRLLSGERLSALKTAMLSSSFTQRWLDPVALGRVFDEHAQHAKHGKTLWRLMIAAVWFSLFILRPGQRPSLCEDPSSWIC